MGMDYRSYLEGGSDIYSRVEARVKETVDTFKLIKSGEKVGVALSGGKDSTSVLYILKKLGYDVHALMLDLHYGEWSLEHNHNMEHFCQELGVPLTIVDMKKELGHAMCFIKAVVKEKKKLSGVTVCGVMKRWFLNRWAKKLGFDKLVTGHNLDDEAQNVLMNFLKGNILLGINSSPATGNEEIEGFVQRIKPLFFVPEGDVRKYAKGKKFKLNFERCPCAQGTYRGETRDWMERITDEEKMNLVIRFQEDVLPHLRKKHSFTLLKCKQCGEPSRHELCSACNILKLNT